MLRPRREKLKILQVASKIAAVCLCVFLAAGCEGDENDAPLPESSLLVTTPILCPAYPAVLIAVLNVTANLPAGTTEAQCTTYSDPSLYEISRDGTMLSGYFPNDTPTTADHYFGYCASGTNPHISLSVYRGLAGTFTVKINLPGLQSFETTRTVIENEPTALDVFCSAPPSFSDGNIETTLTP